MQFTTVQFHFLFFPDFATSEGGNTQKWGVIHSSVGYTQVGGTTHNLGGNTHNLGGNTHKWGLIHSSGGYTQVGGTAHNLGGNTQVKGVIQMSWGGTHSPGVWGVARKQNLLCSVHCHKWHCLQNFLLQIQSDAFRTIGTLLLCCIEHALLRWTGEVFMKRRKGIPSCLQDLQVVSFPGKYYIQHRAQHL